MDSLRKYIDQKKEFEEALLNFIDSGTESNNSYSYLDDFFDKLNIKNNESELRLLLHTLSKISKNHHRCPCFYDHIERIILNFEKEIKQTLTNSQIFRMFKKNRRMILFLLQKHFITTDPIIDYFLEKKDNDFLFYFIPELQNIVEFPHYKDELLENYEIKRQAGENESYLCQMIRDDSVEQFVSYTNQANINLQHTIIQRSLFETNCFLNKKKNVTLIQYAMFFGAIQIVNYLINNDVSLDGSLWEFAIHGNNADLIHILEKKRLTPPDWTYFTYYKESIISHHNEFAYYIETNFLKPSGNRKYNYRESTLSFGFRYYNFHAMTDELHQDFIFFYACNYGFVEIVKYFLNNTTKSFLSKVI